MKTQTTRPNGLDKLVSKVMAQRTWKELIAAIEGGYCPTLPGRNKAERDLALTLREEGYPVYRGGGKFW